MLTKRRKRNRLNRDKNDTRKQLTFTFIICGLAVLCKFPVFFRYLIRPRYIFKDTDLHCLNGLETHKFRPQE